MEQKKLKLSDLLTDESRLCRNYDARTAEGKQCSPDDPAAVCWCLIGACEKCGLEVQPLRDIAARRGYPKGLFDTAYCATWNEIKVMIAEYELTADKLAA